MNDNMQEANTAVLLLLLLQLPPPEQTLLAHDKEPHKFSTQHTWPAAPPPDPCQGCQPPTAMLLCDACRLRECCTAHKLLLLAHIGVQLPHKA
jgi:hypothetical protein